MNSSRAGTVAAAVRPRRRRAPGHRLLHRRAGPLRPRPAGRVRHLRPPRQQPGHRVQRGAHRRDHAGDLRLPQAGRGTTARCSSAGTRTACREPAWASALEVLAANDVDRARRRPGRLHADPGGLARDPAREPAASRDRGLADGIVVTPSHNPPCDGGFKYNPPNGGPADTDATKWIADAANAYIEAGLAGRATGPVRAGPRRRRVGVRLPGHATSTTCRTSSTWPGSRRPASASAPTRSAARRVDYWGEIADRHGLDLTVVNPLRRPDLAVHDARLGRQDPDGLLVAVGDGVADRPQGRVRTSPPATTPTPTGTASSRPTAA